MSNSIVNDAMAHVPRTVEDYQIGIICALSIETAAMQAMLDETHQERMRITEDDNVYTLGRIGAHNIVIACLPVGLMGNGPAAVVANNMKRSFRIKFGLLVGVGGGVWSEKHDIRLGDVVVSKPVGRHGGVVQCDFGKTEKHGIFYRTGSLNKPPTVLLHALRALEAQNAGNCAVIEKPLALMVQNEPSMDDKYRYQGVDHDKLFVSFYDHQGDNDDCDGCDPKFFVGRKDRVKPTPKIHYGNIASSNKVMKHGTTRDKIAKKEDVICFEMEAAGLMDNFPCLVIKGICDYADSHKNKKWQHYAAATAAAYARELLGFITEPETVEIPVKEHSKMINWLSSPNFWGKQADFFERAQQGTGRWILEDERFKSWLMGPPQLLWCQGEAGAGKTILSAIIIDHLSSPVKSKSIGIAWIYIDYRERDKHSMENLFRNLLVQLLRQRDEIPRSMTKSLGVNWEGAKPALAEYKSWLQDETRKFEKTIVILDALDELCTKELCRELMDELQSLSPSIHLLATSIADVGRSFWQGNIIEIEIQPRKDDVILYIKSRLQKSQQLWNHIEDPSLQELMIEMLTKANNRMFLKAKLILNALENLKSAEEVRKTLNSLPPTYDGWYELNIKQIEMKDAVQCNLAYEILAWLSHALGEVTVKALQEALSVQTGDEKVDEEKQIPPSKLLSVCNDLVVTYTVNGNLIIDLLHGTARKYLRNLESARLPLGHEIILKACLNYLSLPEFMELHFVKSRVDERARRYPLYTYAATYWSDHAIQGNLESTFRDSIVNFLESSQRHSADEFRASGRPSAWRTDTGMPWTDWNKHSISRRDTPLHAAASYGLGTIVGYLINRKGYGKDLRNNFGETALHRSAQVGSITAMEELLANGADLNAKVHQHYLNEATPLIFAAMCLQTEAVRVLLNHGADVNQPDSKLLTCPLHLAAAADTETTLTRLLLNHGAIVDFPAKSPFGPETWPMTPLHFAVLMADAFQRGVLDRVNILLDRGADINSKSSLGNTALHMAVLGGYQDLTRVLLQRGTDITLRNTNNKSVIQLAREKGCLQWIEEGAPRDVSQSLSIGPDLHKATWSKNYPLVHQLLKMGHDVAEKDQEGLTPWDYCILSADVELSMILLAHTKKHKSCNEVGSAGFETGLKHMTAFDYTDLQSWEKILKICEELLPFRKICDPNLEFAKKESPTCIYKKTFLILAAQFGRLSQVKFLLDCGSDVNATDVFGETGIHYAVTSKNIQMVKLLIEKGSNLKLKNNYGNTALISAEISGDVPITTELKAALSRQSQTAPISSATNPVASTDKGKEPSKSTEENPQTEG